MKRNVSKDIICDEIKGEELLHHSGGVVGIGTAILIGLAISAGAEIFGDWDNFKNGLMGRPEAS